MRLRQEAREFKASLGYIVKPCLNTENIVICMCTFHILLESASSAQYSFCHTPDSRVQE
jgi:hypothetical protein